jgi:tRNA(Ile2) C34 agmatinyltransferase TiaS
MIEKTFYTINCPKCGYKMDLYSDGTYQCRYCYHTVNSDKLRDRILETDGYDIYGRLDKERSISDE